MSSITDTDIQRVLHSPFDIDTHKKTFHNYLEVVLDEVGRSNYMQQVTLTMLKANGVYFGATKEGPEGYVI